MNTQLRVLGIHFIDRYPYWKLIKHPRFPSFYVFLPISEHHSRPETVIPHLILMSRISLIPSYFLNVNQIWKATVKKIVSENSGYDEKTCLSEIYCSLCFKMF
jgi:hypothetical protein